MRMPGLRVPLVLAALLLLPRLAAAQDDGPEQVAQRYFATMRAGDWRANAALMHPQALESFKAGFVRLAAPSEAAGALEAVFGVRNVAELQAVPAAELYERFMRKSVSESSGMQELFDTAEFQVVGHVAEGEETAHVVYRLRAVTEGMEVTRLAVITLRRHQGAWKVVLTGEVAGFPSVIAG
ncbi:MAG TPA: hypothetical protein VEW03_15565 [Longimicrobiaceae bacterium]|nr:hypothetical protein [Longimicrobiaceae bacterium]